MPFKYNPFTRKMDIVETDTAAGAILTITGNTGGAESPAAGNFNVVTENSTVKFAGTAATETLDFGNPNLLLGGAYASLSTEVATNNTALGYQSLNAVSTASSNSCIGSASGLSITTSAGNTSLGYASLSSLSTGSGVNVAIGNNSLSLLATGTRNIAVGLSSGSLYSGSESSNIVIGSAGAAAESNTIRIGSQGSSTGQQNRAFVAGVTGVTAASSAPVGVDSSGQLSSLGTGSSGQVLTSTGTTSPAWQTLPPAASDALVALNATISNVTGDNTFYGPILFDTELFDLGSNYNPATGLFTAPTTGRYLCCASITLEGLGAGHTAGEMRLLINGSTYTRSSFNPFAMSSSGLYTYTFSLVVPVTAAQTLGFGIAAAGSTKTVGIQGNNFGYYSFANFTFLG